MQPEISLRRSPSCLRERSVSVADKDIYTWVSSALKIQWNKCNVEMYICHVTVSVRSFCPYAIHSFVPMIHLFWYLCVLSSLCSAPVYYTNKVKLKSALISIKHSKVLSSDTYI